MRMAAFPVQLSRVRKSAFRFCEKTLRKQMNPAKHSLGSQGMPAWSINGSKALSGSRQPKQWRTGILHACLMVAAGNRRSPDGLKTHHEIENL
jgi:hypothetical protein